MPKKSPLLLGFMRTGEFSPTSKKERIRVVTRISVGFITPAFRIITRY